MFNEVKVATSSTNQLFLWRSPEPLYGTGEGNQDPTVTIRHPTVGTTTLTMSCLGLTNGAERTATAVSSDRKTITLTGTNAIYQGAQGSPHGAAWFVTPYDGFFDIEVRRAADNTLTLAEPLPAPVSITSNTTGLVQWATWGVVIPATYLATVEVNVPWQVSARIKWGEEVGNFGLVDEGLMHFVRQPFRTGLTSRMLLDMHPGLAARIPRRQGSFDPQIDMALAELIERLREDLLPRGYTEDSINGHRLRLAHAALAAAYVYDETQPEKAEMLRTRALGPLSATTGRRVGGLIGDALRNVWVDLDGDAVVDDGEMTTLEGNRTADTGSFFTSTSWSSETRRFTYRERH